VGARKDIAAPLETTPQKGVQEIRPLFAFVKKWLCRLRHGRYLIRIVIFVELTQQSRAIYVDSTCREYINTSGLLVEFGNNGMPAGNNCDAAIKPRKLPLERQKMTQKNSGPQPAPLHL
jgi:hypothetical protein